jgi:hypothetical protein
MTTGEVPGGLVDSFSDWDNVISARSGSDPHQDVTAAGQKTVPLGRLRLLPVSGSWERGVRAGEQGRDFTDGQVSVAGLGELQVGLDLVAIAAAVFLLDHVAQLATPKSYR